MRWRAAGGAGPWAIVAALCGASLAACAALTGLDDYDVAPGGAGGEPGAGGRGGGGRGGEDAASSGGASSSASAAGGGGAGASSTSGGGGSGGSGGGGVQVPCNDVLGAPGEICCHYEVAADDYCSPPGQCASKEAELACAGPADCPDGMVCCGDWSGTDWLASDCQAACDPTSQNIFCGDAPQSCPVGTVCFESDILGSGYGFCAVP